MSLLLVLALAMRGAGAAEPAMRLALVAFDAAPFPYDGINPGTQGPFLDVVGPDGRLGHRSDRGGVYWRDITYADRRVLIGFSPGFNPARAPVVVVFLHGNGARLERDVVARQRVPAQVAASGLNAVLVAPQLAVDALDSSAGGFWEAGFFARFLAEFAERGASGAVSRAALAGAPVILVAYSGGYDAAAYALAVGGADSRIRGVVLLDAVYGEIDKFADWVIAHRQSGMFFSAWSGSSAQGNVLLRDRVRAAGVAVVEALPARLRPGRPVFLAVPGGVGHGDFVTRAWTEDPLAAVLRRMRDGMEGGEAPH